ncbi:EF hand domain-containing protein [Litoreibacter ponti]|uniref:EF hand domain-containing protein n=1 Tax=Litoreibacter ponti TaxID=1510457 RepID=A0A2T6BLF4_9RHOB|nr:EF-hand domain-containing protein [Litoreibacter ponti]PTX56882.1 EF hand domain-containing protein [Litoreibacter ponti]
MTLMAGTLKTKLVLAGLGVALALTPIMAEAKGGPKGPRASFEELDANGDGGITQAEMQAHRMARFAAADADNDGSITREELLARAQEGAGERMSKRVDRMIERLDANDDGALSEAELTAAVETRGGRGFSRADADGDGSISKAEFEALGEKRRGGGHKRGE